MAELTSEGRAATSGPTLRSDRSTFGGQKRTKRRVGLHEVRPQAIFADLALSGRQYFKFLDEKGGFFYERWGDGERPRTDGSTAGMHG